jgi:ferrous iron transport protein A
VLQEISVHRKQGLIGTKDDVDLLKLMLLGDEKLGDKLLQQCPFRKRKPDILVKKLNGNSYHYSPKFGKLSKQEAILLQLNMKRLSELEPGQKAIIHSFENDEIFLKLMEMGCVPGEEVLVEMLAPLGDPISIKVAGYQLSLRIEEARSILVNPSN